MKRTKAELISDLENMTHEKDVQYDRAENLQSLVDNLEEMILDLEKSEETLDILLDLINLLYVATLRFNAGIESERETIDNLTEKILDFRETTI
jgi:hypothetical protein